MIIENVAEIYNAFGGIVRKEIVSELESWGYKVNAKIINMSRYGIPQIRLDAISDLPLINQGESFEGKGEVYQQLSLLWAL